MASTNQKKTAAARNSAPASGGNNTQTPGIQGLSELVRLVQTIASTPPGQEATIEPNTLEALEVSPLGEVLSALKPIFLRLSIAEAAVEARSPWARAPGNGHSEAIAHLRSLEGKMDDLQRKNEDNLKNMVRENDLKATAQGLETKVTSCQKDTITALTTSTQTTTQQLKTVYDQVKAVPDAIKHQITALNAQIADLRTEVLETANSRAQQLEIKNETLERELADMRKDAKAVSTALIPVAYALECAISGSFTTLEKARADCVDELLDTTPVNITTLAGVIQVDTFKLASSCQALFSVVQPSMESSGRLQIGGGFEERWCSAMESAHTWRVSMEHSHYVAGAKMREAEMHRHQLMLFGYLVDQVRDGQYVLDNWADATGRPEYEEYMDGAFDGFDALQTVAEEMHRLRQDNAKLKRHSLPRPTSGRTAGKPGWSVLSSSQSRRR